MLIFGLYILLIVLLPILLAIACTLLNDYVLVFSCDSYCYNSLEFYLSSLHYVLLANFLQATVIWRH